MQVSILLPDNTYATLPAAVIGTDPSRDLAVLKVR